MLRYVSSDVLVYQKRPGEAVQTQQGQDLATRIAAEASLQFDWLQPVHRIDQPVGGLVLFARSAPVFAALHDQIRATTLQRHYLAVVSDRLDATSGQLRHTLAPGRGNRSVVATHGRDSVLHYRYLGATRHHHAYAIQLQTGRHHQVRAQFAAAGAPVVGDAKYGARRKRRDGSIALLAYALRFVEPTGRRPITVRATAPGESLWHDVFALLEASDLEA